MFALPSFSRTARVLESALQKSSHPSVPASLRYRVAFFFTKRYAVPLKQNWIIMFHHPMARFAFACAIGAHLSPQIASPQIAHASFPFPLL